MNTILIMIATTAIFFIGIQVGYNLREKAKIINQTKTEEIKENTSIREDDVDKGRKEEIIRLNKIMSNLDNFNGTKDGQVDID